MIQEMRQVISIIPTCIDGSCLPKGSALTLLANALMIALLTGLARHHLQKSQA